MSMSSPARKIRITVGLVSCSKSKLDDPAPARDLYSPSYIFRKSVEYVEKSCDEWLILSAKHGVVDPGFVIAPYDETLSKKRRPERSEWDSKVRCDLEIRYKDRDVTFIVMAGSLYAEPIRGMQCVVIEPLRGLGTGKRIQWLALHA